MRFCTFVIVATLLCASLAPAQTTRPERGAGPERSPAMLVDQVRQAMDGIQLSDDQKTRLDAICKEAKAELDAELPKLREASQAERLEKLRGFMTSLRDRILPVLTDEQKPVFEEKIRQLREAGGGGGPGRGRPGLVIFDELADKLELSPEQKAKFDALRAEARQKMEKAREELQGDMQAMREKGQAIFRETREKFDEMLTPEQRQKMRELLQQARPGGPGGGPGGGGGGGGVRPRPRADEAPPASQPSNDSEKPKPAGGGALAPPPVPGQAAPALALQKLDGSPVQLSSFKGKLLLLAFGSYSSPSFRQRAQSLEELRREYGARVNVVVVYTKEAHATGGWEVERNRDSEIAVPPHADENARRSAAKQARELLKLQATITTDSMDDATAMAYHAWPNNAGVLIGKDGNVLTYQEWFDAYGMREAIQRAFAPAPSTRSTGKS